jgi:phage terminase large subunit
LTEARIKIPEKLGEIFEGPARYRVAYGGRGSGKSMAFARMLLAKALEEKTVILCCRELQKSMKDSVHSLLCSQIEELGMSNDFDVGREYLRAKNGTNFLFYGLRSNAAEIKSTQGVKYAWVEEAQAVSDMSLRYLLPTVRLDDSEVWFSFNPEDELDPVYNMFVANTRGKSKVGKINYYDNPFFPQVLEDERLEDLKSSPDKYHWIWEGGFNVNMDAAVYGKWMENASKDGRIRKGVYDPALPVHTSWDIGFSDDTAIWWWQVTGGEVRFIDYYEMNREDIKHYAEQIYGREIVVEARDKDNGRITKFSFGNPIEGAEHRAAYKYGTHYAPHDAANKLFQAGGRSTVQQFQDVKINMVIVPSTSQQNQIDATRPLIDISYFDEDRCKQGIRCLRKYQFKKNENKNSYSKEPDHDLGGYSHGCDAYEVVAQVWKSAKIPEKPAGPRFFEQVTVNELFYGEENNGGGYDRI